jgi:hypothetical protein
MCIVLCYSCSEKTNPISSSVTSRVDTIFVIDGNQLQKYVYEGYLIDGDAKVYVDKLLLEDKPVILVYVTDNYTHWAQLNLSMEGVYEFTGYTIEENYINIYGTFGKKYRIIIIK